MIDTIAADVPPCAEKLLAAFCPGPITLILRRKAIVPDRITGGLATVGIRMPENAIARAMIRAAGVPIAAPSANISGRPSPTTAASVLRDMQGRIPLILDGGPCRYGVESTIIDCTETPATILRPGAITREMLEELLGGVRLDLALVGAHTVPKAPGMKYRHYAPKAPLTLIEGAGAHMDAAFRRHARILQQQGETVGILASHETCAALADLIPENLRKDYGPRGDLPAIAARIYEALISLDGNAGQKPASQKSTTPDAILVSSDYDYGIYLGAGGVFPTSRTADYFKGCAVFQIGLTGSYDNFRLKPCREVGELKQAIKDAIWESRIPNTHEAAREFMMEEARRRGIVVN